MKRFIYKTHFVFSFIRKLFPALCVFWVCLFGNDFYCYAQQPNQIAGNQSSQANYLSRSAVFRQEIARMEINVSRGGKPALSITDVPRVEKGDVIKLRLLDEPVGGIKPDQSYWDWTLLVAFINPNRNFLKGGEKEKSVSEEIQFRKTGWYKEYSFTVPYDSQPVFFLYPKPKYRDKILKIIATKYEDIQKLGEKTIEIAGAYAQINSFLNELQTVLVRTQSSAYGSFVTYPDSYLAGNGSNNNLGSAYNPNFSGNNPFNRNAPFYNYSALVEQSIERLARSFNIQLPACWNTLNGNVTGGGYNLYNRQNDFGFAVSSDLIGRAQCVAKNVRLEDFDFSIANLLKQGGIFAAAQLRDKYPQLAYWINVAAIALDFIVRAFQKTPLKIVPTIVSTNGNPANSILNNQNNYLNNPPSSSPAQTRPNPVKISLFAESQPSEQGFVSAYPIIVQRWQQEPDAEVISLYPPAIAEPCLHVGMNLLKNTDLKEDASADSLTRDFRLVVNSASGFKKEFPLKKNLGLGGWELSLTREEINSFPKGQTMEAILTGTRGFNEIKSPVFKLPPVSVGIYEITPESQKNFTVGGKRTITVKNTSGDCRCIQAIVLKISSGNNQTLLMFEANAREPKNKLQFSPDGKEVSFEIETTNLPAGNVVLEIRTYGGEAATLPLKLNPPDSALNSRSERN